MDDGKSLTAFSSTLMPEPEGNSTSNKTSNMTDWSWEQEGNSTSNKTSNMTDWSWEEESWNMTDDMNGTTPADDYIPDWYQYYDC